MGVIKHFSTGSTSAITYSGQTYPNPDPKNFRIVQWEEINRFLLVQIHYPDCTNYEGHKILVFENLKFSELKKLSSIDPHFSEKKISPIARFQPTGYGWKMALKFIKNYKRQNKNDKKSI